METPKRRQRRGEYGRTEATKRSHVVKFRCRQEIFHLLTNIARVNDRSLSYVVNDALEFAFEDDLPSLKKPAR